MATKAFSVFGEIGLKGAKDVKRELGEAKTAAEKFNAVASSPAVRAAAIAAAGAVAAFAATSVRAYIESETSSVRLKAAVDATGQSYEALADTLDSRVRAAVRSSAYDDEDLADALSTLITTTGDTGKSMEYLGLVTDLARGKNIDLATAANIVGKVAAGNTGILARYGIVLDEGATSTEALGMMQARFAGQATAYANSMQGSMDRVKVAWGNVQEAFGEGLVGDSAEDVQKFAEVINDLEPVAKGIGTTLRGVAEALAWVGKMGGTAGYLVVSALDALGVKVDKEAARVAAFGDTVRDSNGKLASCIPTIEGATDASGDLADATGEAGDAADETAAQTDNLTRAMDGAMVAADSLAGKERSLKELDIATRNAQLDLTAARERLNEVMGDSASTADDVARAQLGVEQAELRAADAAADYQAGIDKMGNPVDVSAQIAAIDALRAAWAEAMRSADNARSAAQRAFSTKTTGGTRSGAQRNRHSGGIVPVSGMYSIQAGEMVLRESQVNNIVNNTSGGSVVVIADPRYTDMAKLERDVRRVNASDIGMGGITAALGIG